MKELLLLLFLISADFASGQEPSLYFEKITVGNGLSHNKVNCIIQDKRGFIWIGTDDGLNRYDGKNFVHFRAKANDTTSISGNIITDIIEDKNGVIWIATADGGLSRFDHRLAIAKQFKQYKHHPGDPSSLPVNVINSLIEDGLGYLWLGTRGRSVIRFDKKTGRFEDMTKSTKTVLDMCLDKNGMIWVGRQGGGIMKINPYTFSYTEDDRYRDLYVNLPHVTVTSFFMDRQQHIWFGSWDRVLFRQNEVTGKEDVFEAGMPFSFQNDEVLSFAEDRLGRIWIGGREKGLHIYDKQKERFYHYSYDPSRDGSIADNRINCIFTDKNGKIWIGTNRGICVNNPEKQQFVQQFLNGNRAGGSITIFDFFEDDEANIWIGTSEGIYIQKPDGSILQKTISYKGNPLRITSIFRDDDGTIYLGTDFSLFRYDAASNRVFILPNTDKDGVMNKIIDSRVVSVVKDNINGNPVLLVSPYGHYLAYYDLKEQRWVSRLDSLHIIERFNLKDNLIRKFYKTRDGRLWMATASQGLGLLSKKSLPRAEYLNHNPADPYSIASNHVSDLVEDDKGNLWLSTYGGGLNYLDTKTNRFTQISSSSNLIEGLQTDHHGNLWLTSNGNLHKYDPGRKAYTSYDLPDLEKTGGIKGKVFRDSRGKIYVSGTNYFISFHPDSIWETRTAPQVYLTDFQIFNRSFSHLLSQDEIRLNYRDNYFAFEFSAPDYSFSSTVQYSYKLEGFDDDWIEAGERTYASYPNLEGGEYVFKVRATNTPGTWSKEFASVKIHIIPPFWKRAWFYIACAVFVSIAVYLMYRYRINELLKRQAIRNKIAQDLHDNVGSTLSSISVYSQVARIYQQQAKEEELSTTLEKISSTSSEMISELNDTVWAINPRNDQMNIILQRMESFARPLLASQGIQLHLHHDPDIASLNLEMEKRKNFYLIFKEAVNNTLKYSGCKNLWVEVRQKGNHILMSIKDDGKGFDLAKTSEGYKSSDVYGGGNGLKNMQLRAKEMKGSLKISSEPDKGTTVKLDFPIT